MSKDFPVHIVIRMGVFVVEEVFADAACEIVVEDWSVDRKTTFTFGPDGVPLAVETQKGIRSDDYVI